MPPSRYRRIVLGEELWLTFTDEGRPVLTRPLATDALTGRSLPGAVAGPKRILKAGTVLDVQFAVPGCPGCTKLDRLAEAPDAPATELTINHDHTLL